MKTKPLKCILVCSNHRSGSSALSGCLNLCGVDYGEDKNGDHNWQNPKGYFENDSFTYLHEQILRSIGQSWSDATKITKEQNKKIEKSSGKLVELLNEQFNSEIFFIKDPRILFVYPAYVKALKELNITPCLIWIERNDEEISESLSKAQNISIELALELCSKYRKRFQEFTSSLEDLNLSSISFNDLVKDPVKTIRQIENDFSLDLVSGNEEKIKEFIDPKLKHFNHVVASYGYEVRLKTKIYYLNGVNEMPHFHHHQNDFLQEPEHFAYAFSKNSRVKMVDNEEEADYIIRHPCIGLEKIPINPNKEIFIDLLDSEEQMNNTFGWATNYIMSRSPFLYFKKSCANKNFIPITKPNRNMPLEYLEFDGPYIPIRMSLSEANYNNPPVKCYEDREIDISCFFVVREPIEVRAIGRATTHPVPLKSGTSDHKGMNCDLVSNFVVDFREKKQKYNIQVGRTDGSYDYNSSKDYFDQIKNSKIVVSCNKDNEEGDFRILEAMAGGALLIQEKMQPHYPKHKEHLVYYNNLKELEEHLVHYLENGEESKKIAQQGYSYVRNNCTYNDTCEMILEEIKRKNEISRGR